MSNTRIVNKSIKVWKKVAKDFGIEEPIIIANPSPLTEGNEAVYIDGDLHTEYWGHGVHGYKFQDALVKEMEAADLFIEPYTETIFDVYKA